MKKKGSNLLVLIISIVVLIGVIALIAHFTISKDGAVTKVVEEEKEYNNEEVIEELDLIIRKKYIDIFNSSTENRVSIDEVYDSGNVISKMIEDDVLEKFVEYDEEGNKKEIENKYYIKVSNLKMDITSGKGENGSKKDIFVVEKKQDVDEYVVKYYDNKSETQEIGTLDFTPEV